MGQSLSAGDFVQRKDPRLSREASVRTCASYLSSRASVLDSRRFLDLNNHFFVCNNLVREDPHGYSSGVYYRSNVNVGEGVPFQWETQPGKPKTDHESNDVNDLPLSPPPSSFSSPCEQKTFIKNKQSRGKSRKIYGSCIGCSPFYIKKV